MVVEITVPRLGWNMDEGVFAGWLKEDGAEVRKGDFLFSLESAKTTEDVECFDSGILRLPPDTPKSGDSVRVGAVIGYLVGAGEPFSFPAKRPSGADPSVQPVTGAVAYDSDRVGARDTVEMVSHSPAQRAAEPAISPRARRLAGELHVDWKRLHGGGRTGRIRENDVRAAASTSEQPSRMALPGQSSPISPTRRTIADRLRHSLQNTAPVTLTTTVNATNLVNLRDQFKAVSAAADVPSYTDFLIKLSAFALQQHSMLNVRWDQDRIVVFTEIHIGIAVETDEGLLVPVVRNVGQLSFKQLVIQTRSLIERAREGNLRAEDVNGGTFTVTNLGAFGIEAFTPILNYPQCAILGIGCIQRRPLVLEDRVAIGEQLTLSLTFDHRLVDGAPAARFLQALGRLIENPGPVLMD